MARSKTDDTIVLALGQRRSRVAAEIAKLRAADIVALESELAEIETKLKTIDPAIPTLAEDAELPPREPEPDEPKGMLSSITDFMRLM